MEDFVANLSKWRIARLTLLSVGFVVIGLWMAGLFGPIPSSHRYSPTFIIALGWASSIFFGLCGVSIFKKYFESSEHLRVGSAGICVRSWSDQTIPWSEIANVTTWTSKGSQSIILHLRDPSLFPGRGIVALFAKANRALTGGDISVSLSLTDSSLDDALAAIDWHRNLLRNV